MSEINRIWRFVDFYKLLDLVSNRCLHLTRLDQFEDPHEGKYTPTDQQKWRDDFLIQMKKLEPDLDEKETERLVVEQINLDRVGPRKTNFVSCWFASEYDSLAMWRLFCPSGQGVAIESTMDALYDSLPEKIGQGHYIGPVEYLDFSTESIFDSGRDLSLCKRRSFDFEKEIRLVAFQPFDPSRSTKEKLMLFPPFLRPEVNVQNLIKCVWMPPGSADWQASMIEDLMARYGLEVDVRRSDLLNPIPGLEENSA